MPDPAGWDWPSAPHRRCWRSLTSLDRSLRGTDLTRLMVTLGVALILLELANKLDWLTGGADGLQGVMMGPLLGRFEFDLAGAGGRAGIRCAVPAVLLPADCAASCIRRSAPSLHGDRATTACAPAPSACR
jgi:hypothetical protein